MVHTYINGIKQYQKRIKKKLTAFFGFPPAEFSENVLFISALEIIASRLPALYFRKPIQNQ